MVAHSRWTLVLVTILACQPQGQTQPPVPTPAKPVAIEAESIKGHVAFLADDKQEGRAPGTESDTRVQKYVADAFAAAKLVPAFGDQWVQSFEITDGVRARAGQETLLDVSGVPIAHAMAPFSGESNAPVVARLVYVGHGITTEGKSTGDYAGLEKKVAGAIVVALVGGPDDPHLKPTSTRAATSPWPAGPMCRIRTRSGGCCSRLCSSSPRCM